MLRFNSFFLELFLFVTILFCFVPWSISADQETPDKDSTTLEDVKKDISEAFASIGQYSVQQRDQAAEAARQDLEQLDRETDKLEQMINENWDSFNAEARENWQETLTALRKKRVKAAEWYGGIKSGSAEAWDAVKKGYSNAFSDLEKAWKKAKKDFSDAKDSSKKSDN